MRLGLCALRQLGQKGLWHLKNHLSLAVGIALCGVANAPWTANAQSDVALTADFVEVYRIGGMEAPAWAQFANPGPLGFDARGSLYILDRVEAQVVVLDSLGTLLTALGRRGEGPGEFAIASDFVVWPDGRLAVVDVGHNVLHLFGADGRFERSARWMRGGVPQSIQGTIGTTIEPDPSSVGILYGQGVPAVVSGLVGAYSEALGVADPASGGGVDDRGLYRIDVTSDFVVTVAMEGWGVARSDLASEITLGNLRNLIRDPNAAHLPMFFEPTLHWDVLPDGTIAYSDSSDYVVKLTDGDGNVTQVLTRPFAPRRSHRRSVQRQSTRRLVRWSDKIEARIDCVHFAWRRSRFVSSFRRFRLFEGFRPPGKDHCGFNDGVVSRGTIVVLLTSLDQDSSMLARSRPIVQGYLTPSGRRGWSRSGSWMSLMCQP